MNSIKIFIVLLTISLLGACSEGEFSPIDHHQPFVASVNILQPSLNFYNTKGEVIASWQFEKAYTGAELILHDKIILYGHQLSEADIYELSSGRKIKTIETGLGTTNAYYDEVEKLLFLSNSKSNYLTSYDHFGKKLNETKLRNYPMSMTSNDGKLYVINYKDTILSVVDMKSLQVENEWEIEKSSNGILVIPEERTLWIGGHGEGSKPNQTIDVYHLDTGDFIKEIKASIMPVGFSRQEDSIFVVNHGSNHLTAVDRQGSLLWELEVGANPFTVTVFDDQAIVAGYDDHKLYFIDNQKITNVIDTDKGPFQLLVREVEQ